MHRLIVALMLGLAPAIAQGAEVKILTAGAMKAVVLEAPAAPEALQIRDLPNRVPDSGQVLIQVAAFGLDRSELHIRLGLAQGVTFLACWGSRRWGRWRRARAGSSGSASRSPR